MSTKLDSAGLAEAAFPHDTESKNGRPGRTEVQNGRYQGFVYAIREVAQPIADERDELREALESAVKSIGASAISEAAKWTSDPDAQLRHMNKVTEPYRSILAKYKKP